jgi:predicted P-loop ATPase
VPQLWAEAMMRFNKGEQWWLNDDEAELAKPSYRSAPKIRSRRSKEIVLKWLLQMPAEKRPTESAHARRRAATRSRSPPIGSSATATRRASASLRSSRLQAADLDGERHRRRVWIVPERSRNAPQIRQVSRPARCSSRRRQLSSMEAAQVRTGAGAAGATSTAVLTCEL